MSDNELPEEVALFIREHINAVEQLEILLLLRSGDKEWTALEVSDEIRTGLDSATARLADLESRGLLSSTPGTPPSYRFNPRSPALAQTVAALAKAYAEKRYTVINLIFAKPVDKIRVFARAFRLRKDEDESDG